MGKGKGSQSLGYSSKGERRRVERWLGTAELPNESRPAPRRTKPSFPSCTSTPKLHRRDREFLAELFLQRNHDDRGEIESKTQKTKSALCSYGIGNPWCLEGASARRSRKENPYLLQCGLPSLAALCAFQIGNDLKYYASPEGEILSDFQLLFDQIPPKYLDLISRAASRRSICDDAVVSLLARPQATSLTLVGCFSDIGAEKLILNMLQPECPSSPPAHWEDALNFDIPELKRFSLLLELDLQSANITCDFLSLLVQNTPFLSKLSLSCCTKIAEGLHGSVGAMQKLASLYSLIELDLSECSWCDNLSLLRFAHILAAQKASALGESLEQVEDFDMEVVDISLGRTRVWPVEVFCANTGLTPEGAMRAAFASRRTVRAIC